MVFRLPVQIGYKIRPPGWKVSEAARLFRTPWRSAIPLVLRLLAYRNVGDMGRYEDALAARVPGMAPDITAVRRSGASRAGVGANFEQALSDGGATGVFGRAGWSDGNIESYAFAECDRFASFGGQISGSRWRRKNDTVGIALAQSGLSGLHRAYLAEGGQGLALGDGKLRYGPEGTLEAYYSYQLSKSAALTLDLQQIRNPGCNRDRGPATVVALRLHILK